MTTKSNRLPLEDEPVADVPTAPETENANVVVPTDTESVGDLQESSSGGIANDQGAKNFDDTDTEIPEEAEDHNCTADFKPAAAVPGEFLVPIRDLGEWDYHLRRFSPLKAPHAAALALTASDPRYLRPIVVIEKDGQYQVVDGRFILEAIRNVHPDDDEVMVRVVRFNGGEGEAVVAMCDTALGSAGATRMEMAHGLLALQRANRISQTALAERYAALNKDKVSNMLIAARLQEAYPILFALLEEPHKAPISLGVALNKAVKTLPPADFADLIDRARALVEEGERCGPAELFDLLGIERQGGGGSAAAAGDPAAEGSEDADTIFGADDQPVGVAEQFTGGGERLTLPSPDIVTAMSADEREAAAEGFIVHIRRYFGVEGRQD